MDAIPDRIEDLRPDLRLVFKDLPSKAFVPDPTDADPENNQWKPDKNGKPKNGPFVYKRFFTNATSTPSKKNGKRPVPVTKLTWDVQHRAHGYMGRIYGGAWLRDGLDYMD